MIGISLSLPGVATLNKGVSLVDGLLVFNNRVMTLENRVMRLSNGS